MQKQRKILFLILFFASLSFTSCEAKNPEVIYIRANQLGFKPGDIKTAVIFSAKPLYKKEFFIKKNNKTVYEGEIKDSSYTYGRFSHCYSIDFSTVKEAGNYYIEADGQRSFPFKIQNDIYNSVTDSLMLFFQVQRCGPTNPLLHDKCHLSDVAKVEGYSSSKGVDLTGGWHDAADYVKFLSTTAYTTYMLIFSYEFDKNKFGFDNNKDGVPDILAEAKIGLDWLLRCHFAPKHLITQVQDLRDHNVGLRLPENDSLQYDRTGFAGLGKNQVGMYCAVMSLASRIWAEKFFDYEFSKKCLAAAEDIYSVRDDVPDVEKTVTGAYQDQAFWGKLALGAVELYNATKNSGYLDDSKEYADSAGSDYWWSWGNMNSLAHYKLAKIDPRYKEYILNNLKTFNANKDSSLFHEAMSASWGTTNSLLGAALQVILYKNLTGSREFDTLVAYQRDYILGRNPWGLSFIYNIGKEFPKHLHSQIAHFRGGYLPGALTAGPAPAAILKNYNIQRSVFKYDYFNTDSVKYYDDANDYVTNEPTIGSNATAVFVFGWYSER